MGPIKSKGMKIDENMTEIIIRKMKGNSRGEPNREKKNEH